MWSTLHKIVYMLTMDEISRILALALVAYSEHLYFSTSIAFIFAIGMFIRGSEDTSKS